MKTFSFHDRKNNIKKFETEVFDLIIIGGGINGAGVARDAASRGMKVALIEQNDFASGTSSRSSKLIHGGIRYLENMEFHLVFEALSERHNLFEMAPHLVHPLRFALPLYKGGRVGMFMMGLGMWLYDALSLFQAPELFERLSPEESLARFPDLQSKDLLGSYVYSDAYMDDDRLVHETLRSANSHGAICANYVRATKPIWSKEKKVCGIKALDTLSNKEFEIRGHHIISTVGPWTDEVGAKFTHDWKKKLRPTKGVHLTFQKNRLALPEAVVMGAEKRIVFGIPRHEMVIIGTTDTDFSGPPEGVSTNPEDVKYLLGVIDQYFPGAKITATDIIASYEGVRPLVADGAGTEGKTSREHSIWTDSSGVSFMAGGKYTTYRLMAEQAVEHCLKNFSIEDRVKFNRSSTKSPINPLITQESFSDLPSIQLNLTQILEKKSHQKSAITQQEISWLVDRHGPEALQIAEKSTSLNHYSELEAEQAIQNTMCLNLLDFYTRRVPFILSRKDHGLSELDRVSAVFQRELRLSADEIHDQRKTLEEYLAKEFSWRQRLGVDTSK